MAMTRRNIMLLVVLAMVFVGCVSASVLTIAIDPRPVLSRATSQTDRVIDAAVTTRTVIGSLADISVVTAHGKRVSSVDILVFSSNWTPNAPVPQAVRLCGDYDRELMPLVHTNVSMVYKLASASLSTGCLSLVRIEPWRDQSPWQSIVIDSWPMKSGRVEKRAVHDLLPPASE